MNTQKSAKNSIKNIKNNKNSINNNYFYNEDQDKIIIKEVLEDFNQRCLDRKPYELTWELNMNFMLGNQYSSISPTGEIELTQKNFYWEEREVYNHIAPIIESRLAKLGKVRPTVSVRPTGSEQSDFYSAKLAKSILETTSDKSNLSDIITNATIWSEVTGTVFYKVLWDDNLGDTIGKENNKEIKNGDVSICVCPPFEIYPDSSGSVNIEDCESIIHARAYSAKKAEEIWGIKVEGKDIDTFTFDNFLTKGSITGNSNIPKITHAIKRDHILVIEKYVKPNENYPNGRLIILVGDNLVFDGDLPFRVGNNNQYAYPFIKQVSTSQIGSFWGVSVIERCIPIQRAYNAIKNRKHEFMARLAAGVLAVEDGSVDIDNIEDEGLAPGKILVYRNGSTPPRFIDGGSIPYEFNNEEDRLLNEFISVSGVSELMRDSTVPSAVSSGTALNILIEQDETRLSVTAEYIRSAVKKIAQFIIRLYKQFATNDRLTRSCDENGEIEMFYWNSSQLTSDDVVLDTINELTETPSQRKSMLMELYKNGLLNDENGKLSNRNRAKLIEALGMGIWENSADITQMHIKKAIKENLELTQFLPLEIDEHEIHIEEHTKFILSDESNKFSNEHINKLQEHILAHKSMLFALSQIEQNNYSKKS